MLIKKILLSLLMLSCCYADKILLTVHNPEDNTDHIFKCVDEYIVVDWVMPTKEVIKNIKVGWNNPKHAQHFEVLKCSDYNIWKDL